MTQSTFSLTLPAASLHTLDALSVIRLEGEQADEYLQGQVTCDINALSLDQAQLGCHCDFKGKTWSVFYAIRDEQGIFLLMHRQSAEHSLAELKKYGVFSKVEITDVSDQWQVLGFQGEACEQALSSVFTALPEQHLASQAKSSSHLVTLTTPQIRYLLLAPKATAAQWQSKLADLVADDAYWEAMDIQAGVANIQAATSNEFVPQMMNMQALDAISFDKGCYMGQEVVARTKYLGKNKRAAAILCSDQASPIAAGDTLEMQVGENWRRGGTVLRSAVTGSQTWVLAVVPNDLDVGTSMRAKQHPDQQFQVTPLPYSLDTH